MRGGNRQQASLVDMSRRIMKRWSYSLEERLFWVTRVNRSDSELIASDGGTEELNKWIAEAKWHWDWEPEPQEQSKAIYAAGECCVRECKPRSSLLRLSLAWCQARSDVSTAVHCAKHLHTSSSNSSKAFGVVRARWTNVQKPPQTQWRVKATWGSTASVSSRPDRSCLTVAYFLKMKAKLSGYPN